MRQAPSGRTLGPQGGDDNMAADVSCPAVGTITDIQTATLAIEGTRLVLVIAEVRGRFAAAGVGEVDFQLEVDGTPINALALPDAVFSVQDTVTYAQQDVGADEVVPVTIVRLLRLGPGQRVLALTGSASTQAFEINGNTDPEHGSSLLTVDLGSQG